MASAELMPSVSVFLFSCSAEVMKVLSAKKHAKMRTGQHEIKVEHEEKLSSSGLEIIAPRRSDSSETRKENQVEIKKRKTMSSHSSADTSRKSPTKEKKKLFLIPVQILFFFFLVDNFWVITCMCLQNSA